LSLAVEARRRRERRRKGRDSAQRSARFIVMCFILSDEGIDILLLAFEPADL
jgi:hypothetical protein